MVLSERQLPALFHYLEINPLHCGALLFFGEMVLDYDLKHVFTGR
jgi:hypothetical protein